MNTAVPTNSNKSSINLIREYSRCIVRELGLLNSDCLDTGLTHAESHVLIELQSHGVLGVQELADRLHLDKSTISRTLAPLLRKKWVEAVSSEGDARRKPLRLTSEGRQVLGRVHSRADKRVGDALQLLGSDQQHQVVEGLRSYASALRRSRAQAEVSVRPIKSSDNVAMANIIRTVLTEFGANRAGFAWQDDELSDLTRAYKSKRHGYVVADYQGKVIGGAGFGQLEGGAKEVCELRKMYLQPEARGLGLGKRLLDEVITAARKAGFKKMYLETLCAMTAANRLYEKYGFKKLHKPLGSTGHFGCDTWMVKEL